MRLKLIEYMNIVVSCSFEIRSPNFLIMNCSFIFITILCGKVVSRIFEYMSLRNYSVSRESTKETQKRCHWKAGFRNNGTDKQSDDEQQ